jgi:MFS family permease
MMSISTEQGSAKLGSSYWRLWWASQISHIGDGIGMVAYPWLASAVTREPILLALVGAVQSLAWLLWSLPAGVVVDRVDRRKLVMGMDLLRGGLTMIAVAGIYFWGGNLLSPSELKGGAEVPTNWPLYFLFLITSFLLGSATVFRDNSSVSLMPSIVRKDQYERANGRMWSAELVALNFVGPPVGSLLLGIAFILPIFFDAATFFLCAGLIALIPGTFKAQHPSSEKSHWKTDLKEGIAWLRGHEFLWPLAIILAFVNILAGLPNATYILFAQEVLNTSPFEYALMLSGAALGGVIAGLMAHRIVKRFGTSRVIRMFFIVFPIGFAITAAAVHWGMVWIGIALGSFMGMLFNTVAVSLRQRLIPDQLLGRVNGVYRFVVFAGMPFGTLFGGILVSSLDGVNRAMALRAPMVFAVIGGAMLAWVSLRVLTSERIQSAELASQS